MKQKMETIDRGFVNTISLFAHGSIRKSIIGANLGKIDRLVAVRGTILRCRGPDREISKQGSTLR